MNFVPRHTPSIINYLEYSKKNNANNGHTSVLNIEFHKGEVDNMPLWNVNQPLAGCHPWACLHVYGAALGGEGATGATTRVAQTHTALWRMSKLNNHLFFIVIYHYILPSVCECQNLLSYFSVSIQGA